MRTRHLLLLGTFLLSMLLYVDRVCISTAKESVAGDLGLSEQQMGWVFSAFSLGYALLQMPAGALADRFGPRRVLTAVVCCWSFFTALTGMAWDLFSLLVLRFLFGAGEAGAFPGIARAIYSWQPIAERGLAQGINFSASRLGAAFAMPLVAWMTARLGWRTTFVALGAIGFIWAIGWFAWFRDDPTEHPGISPDERDYIIFHRQESPGERPSRLPAGTVARSATMWLLMGQYFASNFTFFFCLTWLLPHLSSSYELSPMAAGFYAMAPFLAGMLGNWVGGFLVDRLYRRGDWRGSRQIPAMVGFGLASVGLLASLRSTGAGATVFCLAVAVFGADMTLSPSWSICIDIGRRHAGAVSGTMNMAGNLGSFVTALAFPYLKAWTGSASAFFLVGAGLNVLALIAWRSVRPDEPLEAT